MAHVHVQERSTLFEKEQWIVSLCPNQFTTRRTFVGKPNLTMAPFSSGNQRSVNASSVNSNGLNADWNCWLSISAISSRVCDQPSSIIEAWDTHIATTFLLYLLPQLSVRLLRIGWVLMISNNTHNMRPGAPSQGMLTISRQGHVLITMLHLTRLPPFLVGSVSFFYFDGCSSFVDPGGS